MKRATRQESLRRHVGGQILTAEAMAKFLSENFVSVIHTIFVSSLEVAKVATELQARFDAARTTKGTKKHHRFVPVSATIMRVHELSTDDGYDGRVTH